jgi:hypothetical protein
MVDVAYIHKLLSVLTLPSREYRSNGTAWPREDIATLGQTDELRVVAAWIEADGHNLNERNGDRMVECTAIHTSYARVLRVIYLMPLTITANQMHPDRQGDGIAHIPRLDRNASV